MPCVGGRGKILKCLLPLDVDSESYQLPLTSEVPEGTHRELVGENSIFSLHKIKINQFVLLMLLDKDVITKRGEHTQEIKEESKRIMKRTQSKNAGQIQKSNEIVIHILYFSGNEKQTYAKNQELLFSINPSQLNEW